MLLSLWRKCSADPSARSQAGSETWHIWFDDVRVGTMGAFAGLRGSMQWVWTCGIGTGAGWKEAQRSATSYAAARNAFEAA
jgi:hypothetical protein